MSQVLTTIAQAVKDQIEAATLSMTPSVERVYIPLYDRATTTALKIFVLGLEQSVQPSTRAMDRGGYVVKLAIYRQCDPSDVSEMDGLVAFVGELIDLFRNTGQLTTYGAASLVGVTNAPVYDPAQLDSHHTFVSVVQLEFGSHFD